MDEKQEANRYRWEVKVHKRVEQSGRIVEGCHSNAIMNFVTDEKN